MSTITLSRRDLYDRLWNESAKKICTEFGISNADVIELCERHEIPKPHAGYWSQLKAGTACEPPPLDLASKPELEQVIIESGKRREKPEMDWPPIPVPNRLTSPHPVVSATLKELQGRKPNADGRIYGGGHTTLNVAVSAGLIKRAIRIVDVVVKELAKDGATFGRRDFYAYAGLLVILNNEPYPFRLYEQLVRTPGKPKSQRVPDGTLALAFGQFDQFVCKDTVNKPVEDKLGHFVGRIRAYIKDRAEQKRQAKEDAVARANADADRKKAEEEAAKFKKEEEARIGELTDIIARWRLCADIRSYLRELRELISFNYAKATSGGPIDRWIAWAEDYANRIDPFAAIRDELRRIDEPAARKAECF